MRVEIFAFLTQIWYIGSTQKGRGDGMYTRPKKLYYRIAQIVSWFVAVFVYKRKMLRNEIKGKKGAYVVIANHQSMLDFVTLISACRRPMSFVISHSFYSSLPITKFLKQMGVIPKQQFQTMVTDLKRIKAVVDNGEAVVIYPAGLMCEDGLSTPIPTATYKFLKWLGVDVYVARSRGNYFVMPKWAKGVRPGRTSLDIYRLFTKEELAAADLQTVREKTDAALLFDAYREQEDDRFHCRENANVSGLEHVLYQCPHCRTEYSITVRDGNTLYCKACGYAATSDEYGFLHDTGGVGQEIRYVSDWSKLIHGFLRDKLSRGEETVLSANTAFKMIDKKKSKFVEVGRGVVTLSEKGFLISGQINGQTTDLTVPIANVPTLPFGPGKYLEVQHGRDIYRCVLEDGRQVMKFINMVKIYHELNLQTRVRA